MITTLFSLFSVVFFTFFPPLLLLFNREAMNVVIEEPYPEDVFTKVEKKVYDRILAFVLLFVGVNLVLRSF